MCCLIHLCPTYNSRNETVPQERIRDIVNLDEDDLDHRHRNLSTRQVDNVLTEAEFGSLSLIQQDCCLFLFLDGSSFYFDDFLKERTGEYQLQPGRVNGLPHYAKYSYQSVKMATYLIIQPQLSRARPLHLLM